MYYIMKKGENNMKSYSYILSELDNLKVVNPHILAMTLGEYTKMREAEYTRMKEDAMLEIATNCYNNGEELPDMDCLAMALEA